MTRLSSLDVFRGLTVAFMILVNNPGSGKDSYWPLKHATWHGWTPTDLVFPFFLWIVGFSMTISLARRIENGADRRQLWVHALRRGTLIFLIGLALNLIPSFDFANVRIMGVLQRIGLCYLLGSTIYLFTSVRGQIVAVVTLLVGYWLAMTFIPVPGYGAGGLQPDGNFAQWFDSQVLEGHMWSQSKTWDPEGLFSTLPATANVLLGALAAAAYRQGPHWTLATHGAALVILGLAWNVIFPINKPLWTSSYALLTCGLASLTFLLIDAMFRGKPIPLWARPLESLGMNALVCFVGSGLLARILSITGGDDFFWERIYSRLSDLSLASMLYALTEVLLFIGFAVWLRHHRVFIRL